MQVYLRWVKKISFWIFVWAKWFFIFWPECMKFLFEERLQTEIFCYWYLFVPLTCWEFLQRLKISFAQLRNCDEVGQRLIWYSNVFFICIRLKSSWLQFLNMGTTLMGQVDWQVFDIDTFIFIFVKNEDALLIYWL